MDGLTVLDDLAARPDTRRIPIVVVTGRTDANRPSLLFWDMPDDRRTILDRANRMVRQSKTLRKLSEELMQESNDIKARLNVKGKPANRRRKKR